MSNGMWWRFATGARDLDFLLRPTFSTCGEKPAGLAVQAATKFEPWVNAKKSPDRVGARAEEKERAQLPCLKRPSIELAGATMFVLVQPTAGALPIVGMDAPTVAANTAATTMRTVAVCIFMVPSYSMRIVEQIRGRVPPAV
jgi:hypothetical protein